MFTRRTATVTISAPAASVARRVSSNERYLPEPVINRDWYVLPASTNGSSSAICSPATDEMDDLDRVAVLEHRVGVGRSGDDLAIHLDGDAPRTEPEGRHEVRHRGTGRQPLRLVVHRHLHHRETATISARLAGDNTRPRWYDHASPEPCSRRAVDRRLPR